MRILAIDPGGTVGYAMFWDGKLIEYGHYDTFPTYYDFLVNTEFIPDVVVCEDYIIDIGTSGFNHRFDKGDTLRKIGAIDFWAYSMHIPLVLQQRSIKVPASAMAFGVPYKKGQKKNQHHYDAVLHGVYYMMTKLKMKREDFKL